MYRRISAQKGYDPVSYTHLDVYKRQAYLIHSHTEYTISYKEKNVSLNKLKLAKRDGKGVKIRI